MQKLALLFLMCAAALFGRDARVTNFTRIFPIGSSRPDACHSGCTTGQEVLYDRPTGAPCPNGGNAYQIWTNNPDGTNPINLSATTALSTYTLNAGAAEWSYDGKFIIFTILDPASAEACNASVANPGACFDCDAVICAFPIVSIASCVQVITITPGIGAGTLHPQFNSDGTKVAWMHVIGAGGFNAADQYGNYQTAQFTSPGGTPTLGTATITCPGHASCTGIHEGYEPAGANPCNPDQMFYSLFGLTWDLSNVYSISIASRAVNQVRPDGEYSEFHYIDSTCSLALSGSSQFTPTPNPINWMGPGVPPSDVAVGSVNSQGGWLGLTTYQTPGTSLYSPLNCTIGHPVWGNGQQYIFYTLVCSGIGAVWRANFTPAASYISGQTTLSGQVTLGTHP